MLRNILCAMLVVALALLPGCGFEGSTASSHPQGPPSAGREEAAAVPGPITGITEENYPRVDGSTAAIPLMASLYAKICGVSEEVAEGRVPISVGTNRAWQSMESEENAGLIIAYEAPESTMAQLEEAGVELEITPLGRDGLVFLTSKENPVESLSLEQLRGIYAGEITDWSQVGGEAGSIIAYQRNEDSGSQTLFRKLLIGDGVLMPAPIELIPGSMGGLIEAVAAFDGSGGTIGYSVFYYADLMYANPHLKLLSVEGVAPSKESIGSGTYPLVNDFYVAIRADAPADSSERLIRDWLLSPDGAALLEEAGYVTAG